MIAEWNSHLLVQEDAHHRQTTHSHTHCTTLLILNCPPFALSLPSHVYTGNNGNYNKHKTHSNTYTVIVHQVGFSGKLSYHHHHHLPTINPILAYLVVHSVQSEVWVVVVTIIIEIIVIEVPYNLETPVHSSSSSARIITSTATTTLKCLYPLPTILHHHWLLPPIACALLCNLHLSVPSSTYSHTHTLFVFHIFGLAP